MKQPEGKIRKREMRYRGQAFDVYRYVVEFRGSRLKRDIIERAPGVVIVPIDSELNVILIREFCAGASKLIVSLPGGSVENRRNPRLEAIRELREEIGYRPRKLYKLHYAYSHPSTSNRRSYAFLAYDLVLDPLSQSGEIIELVRLPVAEAIRAVQSDFVSDVSTIGNLLMARDRLRKMRLL